MGHKSPTTVRGTPATRLANGNYVCCAPHIYSHTHTHIRKESANNQHVTNIKKKRESKKKIDIDIRREVIILDSVHSLLCVQCNFETN